MKLRNRLLSSLAALTAASALSGAALAATPKDALVMAWNIDAISTFDPAQIGEVVTIELIANTCDRLMEYDPADPANILP
ncbi:MAG: ABC transporter substrate-binding protein, partial [Falsigemmobacter intermedius]